MVRLITCHANGHDNMGLMKPPVLLILVTTLIMAVCLVGAGFPVGALYEGPGGPRSASAIARSLKNRPPLQQEVGQDTLKVNVELVNVQLTVSDRHGRFVPDLTAKDFLVEEDGRRQEIRNFARENELPLTLAMLVDTSPSVRPVFEEEKATAANFLER